MLAIDHIVITAHDPKKAATEFGKRYDIEVVKGGEHENWGTYNYLAYFANNCYLEWIGLFDKHLASRSDNPLIQQVVVALENNEEKLIQYALRTANMDQFEHKFKQKGVSYRGPISAERTRPDGSTLSWRMLFPEPASSLPFLIEWNRENKPADLSLINQKELSFLEAPTLYQADVEKTLQLAIKNNQYKAKNALIKYNTDKEFTFTIT
ncbi:VOC family protein [Oceanobacillus kapialis]|uniref:VOC family protein n=1 Tax=Oceanobacillus kapialis TaxID=481353 RepID=A0ABW5PV42_9BACI